MLKTLRLIHLSQLPPTLNQMGAFHAFLEEAACRQPRLVLPTLWLLLRRSRAGLRMGEQAYMMMHDLLVQLSLTQKNSWRLPCANFISPRNQPRIWNNSGENFLLSSRDAASLRGFSLRPGRKIRKHRGGSLGLSGLFRHRRLHGMFRCS